ncbi:hypothetical protein BD410DRAFT_810732 [Rickenella mellea]|uniref:Uncharacterized protein n=1 Tax=Rickenella mellea TaxID=50990 RepID=A0A4Y7PEI3_9AGAM|nr:hypothetical protein BD410DRAFT_810732 [Rickenella mellea]
MEKSTQFKFTKNLMEGHLEKSTQCMFTKNIIIKLEERKGRWVMVESKAQKNYETLPGSCYGATRGSVIGEVARSPIHMMWRNHGPVAGLLKASRCGWTLLAFGAKRWQQCGADVRPSFVAPYNDKCIKKLALARTTVEAIRRTRGVRGVGGNGSRPAEDGADMYTCWFLLNVSTAVARPAVSTVTDRLGGESGGGRLGGADGGGESGGAHGDGVGGESGGGGELAGVDGGGESRWRERR